MYTPFEGRLLQQVLEKLHRESRRRMIRLFTYGPCTATVSRQRWLKRLDRQSVNQNYRLGAFNSL
jgi:hypothetical protein